VEGCLCSGFNHGLCSPIAFWILIVQLLTHKQPSATGSNWEKYQKNYADDEVEEKKITPLTDESVKRQCRPTQDLSANHTQGYPSPQDLRCGTVRGGDQEARTTNKGEAAKRGREDRDQGTFYKASKLASMVLDL
jgi:hypothetical protein